MQGESSDEDKSTRSKAKVEKKTVEKHVCSGNNIAGVPCGSSGTEEFDGCHFCWRHISDAQKFIDAKKPAKPTAAAANASEPVAKSKAKVPKASPATKAKGKKPAEELVTEEEGSEKEDD